MAPEATRSIHARLWAGLPGPHRYRFGSIAHRWTILSAVLALGGLVVLALVISLAPLSVSFVVVVGSISAALLLLRPTLGLCLLAFAVPFGSLRQLALGGLTLGASEALTVAVAAVWCLRLMSRRPTARAARGRRGNLLAGSLLLFIVAQLLSFGQIVSLAPALKELAKWIEVFVLCSFVATEVGSHERRWVVAALLAAGTMEGALGIYQFLNQIGPPGFILLGRYMRAHGTFLQPNPYAGYLGLLLPLSYVTALSTWADVRDGSEGRTWRIGLGLLSSMAAVTMSLGLVMSWSRGGLLGLAGGALLVALAWGRRWWLAASLLALLLVALGPSLVSMLPQALVGRMLDILQYVGQDLTLVEITDENFALIERAAHWQAAWRMFVSRPWLGVGVGQYAVIYPSVAAPRWQDPLGHAHNYYLHLLAEAGLVGLSAYLFLQGTALAEMWRLVGRSSGLGRCVALGALGMLGHLLAHNLFDNLYVHELYLLVAMVVGLAVSGVRSRRLAEPTGSPGPVQPAYGMME